MDALHLSLLRPGFLYLKFADISKITDRCLPKALLACSLKWFVKTPLNGFFSLFLGTTGRSIWEYFMKEAEHFSEVSER